MSGSAGCEEIFNRYRCQESEVALGVSGNDVLNCWVNAGRIGQHCREGLPGEID